MRNWIDSAEDSDYWRALVNAALNLRVSYAMAFVSDWIFNDTLWLPVHYVISHAVFLPQSNTC